MKAPRVYIESVPYSSWVDFQDRWKQEYLGDWWMEEQNKMRNVVKSDWNEIDKLFKEEL